MEERGTNSATLADLLPRAAQLYGSAPAIQYKDGAEPLVPRLHDLALFGIHTSSELETILAVMIESRWNSESAAVARWTRIRLAVAVHTSRFSRDFLEAIKALKRKGVPVDVSSW